MENIKCKPITNGDRIRVMTDEELAEKLQLDYCPDNQTACAEDCKTCWLRWLQKPIDGIVLEELWTKSMIELQEDESNG